MTIIPNAGGGRTPAPESQTGELPDQAASENTSVTELKDTSRESLSSVFKALVEKNRAEYKDFHPTLSSLTKAVSAFQDIGLDGITLEQADFENLQRYNLYYKDSEDEEPNNVIYALLGIYNAVFVVRIHPENLIECHAQNVNSEISVYTCNVAAHRFWYKTDKHDEPDFFQYDLGAEEDRIAFASTVLQTAAVRTAAIELKEYDVTTSRVPAFPKAAATSLPKIK